MLFIDFSVLNKIIWKFKNKISESQTLGRTTQASLQPCSSGAAVKASHLIGLEIEYKAWIHSSLKA